MALCIYLDMWCLQLNNVFHEFFSTVMSNSIGTHFFYSFSDFQKKKKKECKQNTLSSFSNYLLEGIGILKQTLKKHTCSFSHTFIQLKASLIFFRLFFIILDFLPFNELMKPNIWHIYNTIFDIFLSIRLWQYNSSMQFSHIFYSWSFGSYEFKTVSLNFT